VSLPDPIQVGTVQVTFRPVVESDREFLYALYASTRADELAAVPWTPAQKQAFVRQQFEAQDLAYRSNYPGAEFQLILIEGCAAGRLFIHRRQTDIRIMDIALLPEFRSRGIGSSILTSLTSEGSRTGRTVTIHVEVFNPARRLYERFGFRGVSVNDVYLLMEWSPEQDRRQG
jgi:ribosomal protein S18 acetylase RimI-like enzyme